VVCTTLLRECPAETPCDFARTEPREPGTDTAGPTAHRQWQQLLFFFHHRMERSGIAHHVVGSTELQAPITTAQISSPGIAQITDTLLPTSPETSDATAAVTARIDFHGHLEAGFME